MTNLHTIHIEMLDGSTTLYHVDYDAERCAAYARAAYRAWHNNHNVKNYRYLIVDGVRSAIHSK